MSPAQKKGVTIRARKGKGIAIRAIPDMLNHYGQLPQQKRIAFIIENFLSAERRIFIMEVFGKRSIKPKITPDDTISIEIQRKANRISAERFQREYELAKREIFDIAEKNNSGILNEDLQILINLLYTATINATKQKIRRQAQS